MNAARNTLKTLCFLSSNRGTVASKPIPARLLSRNIPQLFRTMASTSSGEMGKSNNSSSEGRQKRGGNQKEPLRKIKAKENRQKRGFSHNPAKVHVQVLGAGTRDSSASLYVFSDFNRYLFNCGEGTQRLMYEHKLRAARLDNIFLTRMNWDNVGGLAGMILTLRDIGVPECVLSGPPQLENYLDAIKSFSGSPNEIKLSVRPFTDDSYRDETMTVTQVPLFAPSKSPEDSPQNSSGTDDDNKPKATRDPSLVVAFICKLHPRTGKFLVLEAEKLGLPLGTRAIGPLVKALKNGQTIEYEGKQIRPEQVCTPTTDPGPVFLVVECPSEEFIQSVCTNQQLLRHVSGAEDPAVLVVHFTPESVLSSEPYQRWMESFPSSTEHLILNEQAGTVHNIRSHKLQTQLHMVHPEVFPTLQDYRTKEPPATLRVPNVRAECLLKFHLRPETGWDREAIPVCDEQEFITEASQLPLFLEEVEKSKEIWSKPEPQNLDEGEQFPEVLFLGTGSAIPMLTRNVSGTLLNISSSESVLLDCGEGTFGQLCRHYGNEVDQALSKINTIFVSHIHADHHTGLLKLLCQRERALSSLGKPFSPVFLLGPPYLMTWLNQYHEACEAIMKHVNFISNWSLRANAEGTWPSVLSQIQALLQKNSLDKLETCLVRHCSNAFGCALSHSSGWSLVFSGDTMPCHALVNMGKNATLLIHEATLEDSLEDEAVDKRHSTTSQAIGIGMQMNADFVMLNHFSQRYPKIPLISPDFSDRVGISFDHMRVRFRDLKRLPSLTPALKALFAENLSEMEEAREKRELRNSLIQPEEGAKRQADTTDSTDSQRKRVKSS